VLFNLLGNAAKFTEDGRVTLRARREKENEQTWIHFTVEDTGIGMTEEEQAEIFETFEQADASLTRAPEGAGLGLTITQNLCEMRGGVSKARRAKARRLRSIYPPRWNDAADPVKWTGSRFWKRCASATTSRRCRSSSSRPKT
jgi:signal transduction histidine kinase